MGDNAAISSLRDGMVCVVLSPKCTDLRRLRNCDGVMPTRLAVTFSATAASSACPMMAITSTGPTDERRRREWIAACSPESNLGGATGEGVFVLTTITATDEEAADVAGEAAAGAPVDARRRLWI